jgi:hypothetical protein
MPNYALHLVIDVLDASTATFTLPPHVPPSRSRLVLDRSVWDELGRPSQLDVGLTLKAWEGGPR